MMGEEGYDVKVYIYDISKGMARAMSQAFLGKQLNGIWHTGIVVYGQEFYFGGTGGIECCPPGGTMLGQPDTIKDLGKSQIPYEMFIDYLGDLAQSSYRPERYHLLEHNCNTFSSDVAQFLTGNDIPSQITGLPAEVLSTPFGQMIKPFIDAMSVNPSGGHSVFPQGPPAPQPHGPSSASKPTSQSQNRTPPTEPTSQSQNKAHPEKPVKERTVNCQQKPFVFNQEMEDASYWSQSKLNISEADKVLLKEVYEFLCLTNPTWSLGRDHLSVIVRLALDCERSCQLQAVHLLSRLVVKEDIVQLLCHDAKSSFPKLLEMDGDDTSLKTCVVEMLTNCCSLQPGRRLLLQDRNRKLTTSLCVCSLLGDNQSLTQSTTALSQNLCLETLPEDMELELGSALLNCVQKDLNETATYHMLTALTQLMKSSAEVRGLGSVLGVNCDHLKMKSDRVASLCSEVAGLL